MPKYVPCPRCSAEEPPERAGPWFDPCQLCDGALTVTSELAAAYRLCIDPNSPHTEQWFELGGLRERFQE